MKIAVLGATSKTGRHVVARLAAAGHAVTAVGRDSGRLAALEGPAARVVADLERPETLGPALEDAEAVASLAHARFTEALLAALPEGCRRVVVTGSTRKDTRLDDPAAEAVRAAEAAFLASGRVGVMLHPTMIYGAPDDRNVGRILRLLRRWPAWCPVVLPLPGGGRATVQPVFVDDMAAAVVAALTRDEAPGPPIVVAGPEPIAYRDMLAACGAALGRRVHVLPLPGSVLALLARLLPLPVTAAELLRAGENKAYDVAEMERRLGVRPRPFEEGLALKLERDPG